MHSRTSPTSERYILLMRSLPTASIRLVWNRMSGSTTSSGAPVCTAAMSRLACTAAAGTSLVRASRRSTSLSR